MKKLTQTIFVTILCTSSIFAQENMQKEEFQPSGKAFGKIYSNAHITSYDGATDNAFEITRAYFGYGYNFNKNFSGKLNIDVGAPEVEIGDSLEGVTKPFPVHWNLIQIHNLLFSILLFCKPVIHLSDY